jgi:hypothetical protein
MSDAASNDEPPVQVALTHPASEVAAISSGADTRYGSFAINAGDVVFPSHCRRPNDRQRFRSVGQTR